MDITFVILSIILGLVTSVAGGFWGIGGGWLIVPSLLLFPGEISIPVAAAASIMQIVPTSVCTVIKQLGKIGWSQGSWGIRIALPLCGFSFLGGFLGRPISHCVGIIDETRLTHKLLYVALLAYIFYKTLFSKGASYNETNTASSKKLSTVCGIGFFEGILAAFLGCGGGTLNRSIMRGVLNVPEDKTGKICRLGVFLTALSGTIGYSINNPNIEQVTTIACLLAIGGLMGFPLGARLHEVIVKADNIQLIDQSFAIIVGMVLLSFIFRLINLQTYGQVLLVLAGVILVIYLSYMSFICYRKLKQNDLS